MSMEVTPRGTRGYEPPNLPGPLKSLIVRVGALAYRALGDHLRVMGRPLLLLETVGSKSGKRRTAMLGWFPDATDDSWLIVASYGGAARHPAWFLNMVGNPDQVWVEIGKRRFRVKPETLKGSDRAGAWDRIVSLAPGFSEYPIKTDREIPIVRLRRRDEPGLIASA